MAEVQSRVKLLITIVDRERTARAADVFVSAGARLHYVTPGLGTANSDLLDYLGLGETGKSLMISLAPEEQVPRLLHAVREALHLSRPGKGILFTMPLSGVSRTVAQTLQEGVPPLEPQAQEQEVQAMQKGTGRLVVAVVASGHTDTVMSAAKAAGARGGTVLHGRRLDCQEDGGERKLQPERDIVAILVPQELQRPVLEAVNQAAGLATECRGVLFSLPVDEVEGLPGFRTGGAN